MSAEVYTVEVRLPVVLVKAQDRVIATCEGLDLRTVGATEQEARDRLDAALRDAVGEACRAACAARDKENERQAREERLRGAFSFWTEGAERFLVRDRDLEEDLIALSAKLRADFPACRVELRANDCAIVITAFVDGKDMSEDEARVARVHLREQEAAWRATPAGRRWDVELRWFLVELRWFLQEDEG